MTLISQHSRVILNHVVNNGGCRAPPYKTPVLPTPAGRPFGLAVGFTDGYTRLGGVPLIRWRVYSTTRFLSGQLARLKSRMDVRDLQAVVHYPLRVVRPLVVARAAPVEQAKHLLR